MGKNLEEGGGGRMDRVSRDSSLFCEILIGRGRVGGG